jgi:transcription elongation factor GreA
LQSQSLGEALSQYVATLSAKGQQVGLHELNRFVSWCGRDREADDIMPSEVASFGEVVAKKGYSRERVAPIKAFLTYLKKNGTTHLGLASHLRLPKMKKSQWASNDMGAAVSVELTPKGYANLQARRDTLLEDRITIIADIKRAMEDKDFRENAPLDAAKEKQSQTESSLRDVLNTLENAVIRQSGSTTSPAQVKRGHTVIIREMSSGKDKKYTLVDSSEADPSKGKISHTSPVGQALQGKSAGEEVQISVPLGTFNYRIEKILG